MVSSYEKQASELYAIECDHVRGRSVKYPITKANNLIRQILYENTELKRTLKDTQRKLIDIQDKLSLCIDDN